MRVPNTGKEMLWVDSQRKFVNRQSSESERHLVESDV